MRKSKIFLLGLALMVMAACIFTLFACSGNGGGIGSSSETYYYYKNNVKDSEDWIKFEKDTWTDSSDMSGRLEMKNGKFTAYMDIFGEEEIFFFGTVKKGVMSWTLGVDSAFGYQYQDYYSDDCTVSKKDSTPYFENLKEDDDSDNQTPSGGNGGYEDDDSDNQTPGDDYDDDDNENYQKKLVSLIANGGTVSGGELEYYFTPGQKMTGLPTPTRSGYVFDGWVDSTGKSYTSKSTMPDRYLELYANWSLEEKTYSDEYMSFANLVSGKKQNNSYYGDTQRVDTFLYIEFTSADFGGPSKIGDDKIDLRTSDEVLNYTLGAQYNLRWYYDSEYSRENGSQTFVLNYGSNINYVVISSEKVSRCYLIDIYVKHDYYVKKYESIHTLENEEMNSWYNTETGYYSDDWVPEGETISQNTATKQFKDFEFKEWLVYDKVNKEYIPFDFNTKIYENINLYQSYKPKTITTNLNGGSLSGTLKVTPYEKNQTVLTATKTGYDFIGWKLDSERYFADANGFSTGALMLSSNNYFTQLNADFVAKQYMRTEEGESISFTKTVPIISYTDSTQVYLNEVTYVPYGTYCCAPQKVPNTKNKMFKGWMEYDSFGKGNEVLNIFDKQITKAQVIHAKMDDYSGNIVRLNETEYYDHIVGSTMTYAIYLPTNEEYSLYVESNASYNTSFTIKKYGSELADKTLNVRKNYPISTTLQFSGNYYQGWVYFDISNISADFNITVKGATGIDNAEANEISKTKLVSYGDSITLSAKKEGYTLLGWYVGSSKVSNNSLDYTFTMGLNETTFTKVWKECDLTIEQNIAEAGSLSALSKTTAVGKEETLTATTNNGYTFLGWYDGETLLCSDLEFTFAMPETQATYVAKWMTCPITLEKNITEAGNVSGVETTILGAETTIIAETNVGYTWLGWYDGETKVSEGTSLTYTFTMGEQSKTYTAKWMSCPVNLEKNITEAGNVSGVETTMLGAETTIVAETNAGYTWLGWYDGETKVSEGTSLTYTFTMGEESKTYTAKWTYYTISTETNLSGAGTYTPTQGITAGETVTLTASTNNGYTWLGWYDGEIKVSEGTSLTYTFTMGEESKTYTAKWTYYTISTETNLSGAGTYTQHSDYKVTVGEEVTLTATTNNGYTWLGWYDGETKVSEGTSLTYTFAMGTESKTYTAKWYKINLSRNDTSAGKISTLNGKYVVGDEATITATTNAGYTWLGWYDGEIKVSEGTSLTYTFTMGEESKTYTAKWTYYTISTETNLSGAGTYTQHSDYKVTVGEEVTLTATTKNGYTWLGWYDGETKVSEGTSLTYTFAMGTESKTYTAKWYKINLSRNDTSAGTISTLNGKYVVGDEATITATTNAGYTWLGWYDGETKVSEGTSLTYTFTMGEESKTYTAKWSKVEIEKNITEAGSIAMTKYDGSPITAVVSFNLNGASGSIASQAITATQGLTYPTIPTRSGYLFAGWYSNSACSGEPFDFSSDVTGNVTLYAKWLSHSGYGVLKAGNNGSMTLISKSSSSYRYYAFVPLVSETITIYTTGNYDTFGYLYNSSKSQLTYDNNSGSNHNFSISYEVTAGTLYYIRPCSYGSSSVTATVYIDATNLSSGGAINNSYVVGDRAVLTATTTNNGYTWLGWYDGETKVSEGTSLTYTFTMGEESKTYIAKWELCTSHTLDSNCVCTKCNLAHPNHYGGVCEGCGKLVSREGDYVYFGTYPQSEVTDSTLKSTLTGSAGTLPTSSNSGSWTSYGYYISGNVSNYMWYIDKEYEGEKYRGVYFTSYRLDNTTSASSTTNYYQHANGYSTGTVYWFKYEPIKWRILSENDGKALILAELILDSQEFYPSYSSHTENGTTIYANNWEYSTIRKWLNETFYNVAFNDLQKALIVATELDNQTTSYDGSSNSYATCQNNTTDKVFLLSYNDMRNTSYGFSSSSSSDTARRKQTSDYAQVQGASTSTDSSYLGNGRWWLRSPNHDYPYGAFGVSYDGYVGYHNEVYNTHYGVVPALTIML